MHLTLGVGGGNDGAWGGKSSEWAQEVQVTLSEYREDDASRPLWITEHSLGAALATIAAAKLIVEEQQQVQGQSDQLC